MQSVTVRRAAALGVAALNGFIKARNERRSSGVCVGVPSCHGSLQPAEVQVNPGKGLDGGGMLI